MDTSTAALSAPHTLMQLETAVAAWLRQPTDKRTPSTTWLRCCEDDGRTVVYHVPSRRLECLVHKVPAGFLGRPSAVQLNEARGALAAMVATLFAAQDRQIVEAPPAKLFAEFKETSVLTTTELELSLRTYSRRPCIKCNTTGSYQGGRCYPCRGVGHEEQHGKVRDDAGDKVKVHVRAGTRAVAVRPAECLARTPRWQTPPALTRENSRVLCRLESGQFVCIPLVALRLDRAPRPATELVKETVEVAAQVMLDDERWLVPFDV